MATIDELLADLAQTVAAVPGVRACTWPPPEQAPAQGPIAWIDYGPTQIDLASLEVTHHTVTITVATPRKGNYPGEYKLVLETALAIQRHLRRHILIAQAGAICPPIQLGRPIAATYGPSGPPIVACTLTLTLFSAAEIADEIRE